MPPDVHFANVDSGGWWHKLETLVDYINMNSVITSPSHEEFFRIQHGLTRYTLRGYAYAGDGREVGRVEVTLDGGKTWMHCQRHGVQDHLRHGINSWVHTPTRTPTPMHCLHTWASLI
jgi:nitrate reductase (NAD(P)H)